jgi:hypothetical protein
MIKIMINFQNKTQNQTKFANFEIFIFIQQQLMQIMSYIGQLYIFLKTSRKKISFKKNYVKK